MTIQITFPNELLVAVGEDRPQFTERVLMYTLGQFYQQGKISSGFAAQILGCDRWEFYLRLSRHGFVVIDYALDEQEAEAASSYQIAAQKQLSGVTNYVTSR